MAASSSLLSGASGEAGTGSRQVIYAFPGTRFRHGQLALLDPAAISTDQRSRIMRADARTCLR